MGRPDQDQKLVKVQDFMALLGSQASGRTHGASKHVYMDKHTMFTAEHMRTDGSAIMKPSFPDATQPRPSANTRWLYGDNHLSNQANGTLTFTGARHPDWSNSGGRQPYLPFSGSQEPKSMPKVINYQAMHAQLANDIAMAGRITTALNCDMPAYFTPNHPRVLPKVFPFLAPVMQCECAHETPTPIGRTVIPPHPVTEVSSSRILPPNGSSRPSGTQLTIFYGGQINVYNDVSPTQAQDIILKAAACDHLQTNKGKKLDGLTAAAHDQSQQQNKGTLEAEKSIPSVMPNEPGPLVQAALPDFLRLDLRTGQPGQSARDPIDIDDPPASVQEAPQTADSFAGGAQSAYDEDDPAIPKALPQARKASLARFLEKRRERMVTRAPYPVEMSFL